MLRQKQKSALSGALFFNENGDRGGNRTAGTHIFSPVLDDYEAVLLNEFPYSLQSLARLRMPAAQFFL